MPENVTRCADGFACKLYRYVKVVEAWPETDIAAPGYEGWMRWPVYYLYELWDSMGDGAL